MGQNLRFHSLLSFTWKYRLETGSLKNLGFLKKPPGIVASTLGIFYVRPGKKLTGKSRLRDFDVGTESRDFLLNSECGKKSGWVLIVTHLWFPAPSFRV